MSNSDVDTGKTAKTCPPPDSAETQQADARRAMRVTRKIGVLSSVLSV